MSSTSSLFLSTPSDDGSVVGMPPNGSKWLFTVVGSVSPVHSRQHSSSIQFHIPKYSKQPLSIRSNAMMDLLNSSLLTKFVLFIILLLFLLIAFPLVVNYFTNFCSYGTNHSNKEIVEDAVLLSKFDDFQKRFSKNYPNIEEKLNRFSIFVLNLRQLEERIQSELERGRLETEFGVTQFFDWNDEELAKLLMPFGTDFFPQIGSVEVRNFRPSNPKYKRPKEFDWRKKGAITHVKNQLKCGACWAFAAAAVVESQHAIHNGTLMVLSEQQLIDCDQSNNGCEGGYRPNAFRYVRDNGLLPESAYPYRAGDGQCELPPGPVDPTQRVFIDELQNLSADEAMIADFVVEKGPVSFGMNVTKGMYHYTGGIFSPSPEECAQQSLGQHAMEAVGFGEDTSSGTPYWILKNSWGTSYGINGGYLHVRRGVDACGLAREVHTALITRY